MTPPAGKKNVRLRAAAAAGLLAVVLATMLGAFFWFRVCDEQLSGAGKVVKVCRHVATTDPPLVVLGLLALVLLSVFYTEISGFGITLKRRVDELDERSRANEQKAEALEETVDDLADYNLAQIDPAVGTLDLSVPDPRIRDVAARYNTIRWTRPSGAARTAAMRQLVQQLQDALRDVPDFDVEGHLRHEDRAVRLAGFAYLDEHPAPELVGALVAAAVAEDKPFGQYLALRALQRQLAAGARLGQDHRTKLRAMRDRIGPDTDRGGLITRILA